MMGHRRSIWALVGFAVVGGAYACAGGPGGPSDALEVWDPAGSTHDRAPNSTERAVTSLESAPPFHDPANPSAEPPPGRRGGGPPGGPAGGGLDCSGTWECREPDGDVERVTLSMRDGQCSLGGVATLHPDGRVSFGGQQIATWTTTGSTLVVSTDDGAVVCTRIGAGAPSGGSSEPPAPMPDPTVEPPPAPPPGGPGDVPVPEIPDAG